MTITEATREAIKKGRCIERPFGNGGRKVRVKPTNGIYCCIAYDFKGYAHAYWEPTACDLIAEDWEVAEE